MVSLDENLTRNYTSDKNATPGNDDHMATFQKTLGVVVALAAIIGNGLLIFLFCRHKTLRKLTYFLFIDLSFIDFLYIVIIMLPFICYSVFEIPSIREKAFASLISSLIYTLFVLLSLSTVALQTTDRYLAVCWPNFYKVNKTKTKVLVIILLKWILNILIAGIVHIPLYKIDIGEKSVAFYDDVYRQKKTFQITSFFTFGYLLFIVVLGFLSLKAIRKHSQTMEAAGQNANSPTARKRRRAFYTIIIRKVLYFASYLPCIILASVETVFGIELLQQQPLSFLITISFAIPKAVDPLLILWRVSDFKEKVRELKATFCGQTVQEEIQSCPGQISLEPGVREEHFKEENTTSTARTESRLEISNPGRQVKKIKTILRAQSMRDEIQNYSRQIFLALEVSETQCKKNSPLICRTASWPEISNRRRTAHCKENDGHFNGVLRALSMNQKIRNYTRAILNAAEAHGTQYRKEKALLKRRSASLSEISNPRQSAKTRRHSF